MEQRPASEADEPGTSNEVIIDTLNSTTNRLNHAVFSRTLEQLFEHDHTDFAIIAMDVDKFKQYNTLRGLERGDDRLREIADFIDNNIRPNDDIAVPDQVMTPETGKMELFHRSGDEFFILLYEVLDIETAWVIKARLQAKMDEKGLRVSMGVVYAEDEDSVETLLERAGQELADDKEHRKYQDMSFVQKVAIDLAGRALGLFGVTLTRVDKT